MLEMIITVISGLTSGLSTGLVAAKRDWRKLYDVFPSPN